MEVKWWESHDNRIELAHHLQTVGWFKTSQDVIRFFEKPWKWTPEWDEYQANVTEEQLGLDDPEQWARVEEPDEDLRPTDLIIASDPGWITP